MRRARPAAAVPIRPRERYVALAAVALVQFGLGAALLMGLRLDDLRHKELVSRLVEITLPQPPRRTFRVVRPHLQGRHAAAAPRAHPAPIGGSPGPHPSSPTAPTAISVQGPSAPSAGGGVSSGAAIGSGAGGGSGDEGLGEDDGGGTDLVQIAGAILPSDYPKYLRERGVGGRVQVVFTVGTNGRVTSCSVARSSGVPELDRLTCGLIQQRFRYRPSTDRYRRPIPDEVEGEHDWIAGSR